MRKWIYTFLVLTLCSCDRNREFIVFADPWLTDFATATVEAFEKENPDLECRVILRSSEVIAQRLSFGEPFDAVLALDAEIFAAKEIEDLSPSFPLAETRVIRVRKKGALNPGIPRAGGTMMEASDRPLRRATDKWIAQNTSLLQKDSLFIANFQYQAVEYLIHGWVRFGFVPEHLTRLFPGQLELMEQGPGIPGGFHAYTNTRSAEKGERFTKFLASQKCRQLLADYKIIQ